MTATLRPASTGRWGAQPLGFDYAAAETVFKAIMDLPDDESAAIGARILVGALVQHELLTKGYEMASAADVVARRRADLLSKQLAVSALAKARRGQDASDEIAGIALLSKAVPFMTEEEHARYARAQQRDLHSGRFVREHQRIGYDSRFKALSDSHAAQLGVPAATHLSEEDKAHYQQAYQQVERIIAPFTGLGENARVHLHIANKNGEVRTHEMPMPNKAETHDLADHLGRGEHLHSVSVSAKPPTTAAGAVFDAMSPVSPAAAGIGYTTMTSGAGNPDRLADFGRSVNAQGANGQDDYIPSQRVFRNVASGSRLLSDSFGAAAPPKLKMALAVGEHVGRFGPEAQRVIGPTADRAAYRYRGTERALPEPLRNAISQLSTLDVGDKRWYLLHGNAKRDGTTPAGGWRPSMVVQQFRDMLPKADLSTLHLKSGMVPPSRGVVFDKDGKASALAVGYGDDHYLPFNLRGRSFRALKGGEYIRTRTFGGPTTEDVYTGLMSGAKGFTVVSHNGTFTVDFADDLKGGKRFNDHAARMVARYGYLLDAVRSGQVETGGIASSRLAELADQAARKFPPTTHKDQFDREFAQLKAQEKDKPKLSDQQRQRATMEFFNDHATMGRGGGALRQSMTQSYINDEAAHRWQSGQAQRAEVVRRYPAAASSIPPAPSLEQVQAQVQDEIANLPADQIGERYAEILGLGDALKAHLAAAEKENADKLKPLRLNGDGYAKALEALQEEFPHYIADVQYHPWNPNQRRGPLDSGYVRPRHNRPAEALSGYFDRHVSRTGQTKVYADSTRWQNQNARVRPVETREPRAESAEAPAGPKADAGTAQAMRTQADKDLFTAIKASNTFSPQSEGTGALDASVLRGGYPVATALGEPDVRKALEQAAPNLLHLWSTTPEDFERQYAENPDKMRATLAAAKSENAKLKWADLPDQVTGSFDRGGRPAPKRTLGTSASQALEHPHAEHDFGDEIPAYDAAMRPTPAQVDAEYGTNPAIGRLIASNDLPDSVADPEFPRRAKQVLDALTTRRASVLARAKRDGVVPDASDLAGLDAPAEGIVRALQLRRRHEGAIERERDASAITPGRFEEPASSISNTTEFRWPTPAEGQSPEEYGEYIAAAQAATARQMADEQADQAKARRLGLNGVIDQ